MGKEQEDDSNGIKNLLTGEPCLAHFEKDRENIVTTDASKTSLGITLSQKQSDGEIKPIAFGSRCLIESEKVFNWRTRTTSRSLGFGKVPILSIREESLSLYRSPST